MEQTTRTGSPGEKSAVDAFDHWSHKSVIPSVKHHDHGDICPTQVVDETNSPGLFGATIGQGVWGPKLVATAYAQVTGSSALPRNTTPVYPDWRAAKCATVWH
jgi:hypothetical protein